MNDAVITDDEFENLLDSLHGPGQGPGKTAIAETATGGSAAADPPKSDVITDDEFEQLLDQLQTKAPPPPTREDKVHSPPSRPPVPLAPAPVAAPAKRWVCFELATQIYGIEVLQVQEILQSPGITPVPGAAADVLGVINLRGAMVAVLDLHRRLNLVGDIAPTPASRVIVVSTASTVIGLQVDRVADVLQLRPDETLASPRLSSSGPALEIHGLALHQQRLVILLNLAALIAPRPS